jgi:hypothetical protein
MMPCLCMSRCTHLVPPTVLHSAATMQSCCRQMLPVLLLHPVPVPALPLLHMTACLVVPAACRSCVSSDVLIFSIAIDMQRRLCAALQQQLLPYQFICTRKDPDSRSVSARRTCQSDRVEHDAYATRCALHTIQCRNLWTQQAPRSCAHVPWGGVSAACDCTSTHTAHGRYRTYTRHESGAATAPAAHGVWRFW